MQRGDSPSCNWYGCITMSFITLNKSAVREVRDVFYRTCDSKCLSDKDLLTVVLEPLVRDRCVSLVIDQILEKGLPYLSTLSEFELSVLFDLDEKQSFYLMSVFELSKRLTRVRQEDAVVIRSPKDVTLVIEDLRNLDKEHFVVLYLNTKNRVIGRETISVGSLNAAIVHPREVFKAAIRRGAASIIASHNHPSGDSSPSPEDIQLTSRLVEAGNVIGIELLDHVIIGSTGHTSLKEMGHM